MADAVYDFLSSGGEIPKSSSMQKPMAQAAATPDYSTSEDPVHDFLASGGHNIGDVSKDSRGYFRRVKDAALEFQNAINSENKITTAPKAVGEMALAMTTGGLVPVAKHAIAEGAYLSGESPTTGKVIADEIIPKAVYEPQSPAGKTLANLVGTVAQPLVDAGQWAVQKAGLSETAQDVAGDFSPIVIPQAVGGAIKSIKPAIQSIKNATANTGRAITSMSDRFQELQRVGRGEPPLNAPPPAGLTPQMIRGQEPIPAEIQNAPSAASVSTTQTGSPPQPAGLPGQQASAAPSISASPLPSKPLGAPVPESSMPTRAALVGAPALSIENASPQLKQALAGEGPALSPEAIQRHVEADSLPVPVSLTAGQATGDLARLSDELNMRADHPELQRRFNEQNGQMIENVNAIRERVAPDVTDTNHVDNGAALIDSYTKMNSAREAEVSANYKALADANDGNIPVDGKAFAAATEKALGNGLVNKREFLPPTVERIVQRIGSSDQQMTFDDFTTLRTVLAKEARKATQAGDGNASHAISVVRDQLENIPMGAGAEALKPLADTAKNSARALFQDIEKDPAWTAAINGKVTPDNFVKKFVINGARDHLSTMKTNIGTDPVASQTIAASALNYLKERAGTPNDAGNFSQSGYNKALNALRPKLDSLFDPVAAQQVETLGKVARYTQEQPRGSYVNNSNTFTAAVKGTAKAAVGGALNKATYGLSGALGEAMEKGRAKAGVTESLKPAAGVKLSDIPKTR
jgi:hypothetical protein